MLFEFDITEKFMLKLEYVVNLLKEEYISESYEIDCKASFEKFQQLHLEEKILFASKVVIRGLIEDPISQIGYTADTSNKCSSMDAISIEKAKETFKGLYSDDGGAAICAYILLEYLE